MPLEIERKFLVTTDAYRENASSSEINQAYLSVMDKMAIRVRIDGIQSSLAIKSKISERVNKEYEYNIPIEVAKIAKSNYVENFIYVSSLGANPNASGLYLKNKGQAEKELKKLNFPKLSIIRPSILLGNRKENRTGEKIGIFIMKILSVLFFGKLKKYKPIKVENVAEAMLAIPQFNFHNSNILSTD